MQKRLGCGSGGRHLHSKHKTLSSNLTPPEKEGDSDRYCFIYRARCSCQTNKVQHRKVPVTQQVEKPRRNAGTLDPGHWTQACE
jgi:hypothetical protein